MATTPGLAAGRMTLKRAPRGVHPSTFAASSSSRGMPLKYPDSIQMENGREKVRYVRTSPDRVPTSWMPNVLLMLTKIMNSGSRNSTPGNIWVDRIVVVNALRPRNR